MFKLKIFVIILCMSLMGMHLLSSSETNSSEQLIQACIDKDFTTASTILLAQPDLNYQDQYGNTALHWIVSTNKPALIAQYLSYNPNPDIANIKGCTPLHWAAWTNNPEIIQQLIDHGADRHYPDHDGDTPLDYAGKDIFDLLDNYTKTTNS